MKVWLPILAFVSAVLLIIATWMVFGRAGSEEPSVNSAAPMGQEQAEEEPVIVVDEEIEIAPEEDQGETKEEEGEAIRVFHSQSIAGVDPVFQFIVAIPASWEAEYIPASRAINIFDPEAAGENPLEKSQIFVKYFEASQFLTLQTVTIHSREHVEIAGRPAVRYDIEKFPSVSDFPGQPSWRNDRHFVTDIRSTDENPTTFYVFGQRPGLPVGDFNAILETIVFGELQANADESQMSDVVYPMRDFQDRVTLKPFGLYVSPGNSPVSPERFSGYHTAADAETTEAEQGIDTPVFSMAPGTVIYKGTVSGYGGVLIITHEVEGETVSGLYGHVEIGSVFVSLGDRVETGDQLAVLGKGYTGETDGERKHLHFSLRPGRDTTLSGYVGTEAQLTSWIDPLVFLSEHNAKQP